MFEQLSDRLTATFAKLNGRARVSDADLDEALRDVRVALLEADVNFKIVRELVATVVVLPEPWSPTSAMTVGGCCALASGTASPPSISTSAS